LIVGENGSGKSTMLDALCFALFGKAFRNINKPQLLNSINGKDCVVEVEFDVNGKSYKVVRGIKPNIFQIFQDGDLLNQDAASRDYQELLEKVILKLNYKSFTQIVILGSASFVPFMQLSAADRRAIIEDLLDIQIFSAMNTVARDRLSQNKDSMITTKYEIELAQQQHDLEKKRLEEHQQNNDEKAKEYNQEIQNNNIIIETLQEENSNLTSCVTTHSSAISLQPETQEKIRKFSKLESQIESNLSKFRKDISFFEHNDNCPTCRQTIAEEFKENEIENLSAKVTGCEDGLKQIETRLLEEQAKLNRIAEVQAYIQTLQIKIATNNTTINETNKYITKLQTQISELTSSRFDDANDTELNAIKERLSGLKSNLRSLIDEKTYYEVATNLLKDTGIKTKIVKQYLPIINKLVNKYLASLDFFVNFTLDESFKETIKSRHRDEFSYANFSVGEKQRLEPMLYCQMLRLSELLGARACTLKGTKDCARSWVRAALALSASTTPLRKAPSFCRASKE
jgi:DNA repair exonuclease SbcCD ATPase subunit